MNSTYPIDIQDLSHSFKGLKVLDKINLQVQKGKVLALLGPNGAGKTTTIRILSTLLRPESGDAFVGGHSVVKNPELVRAKIGLTGQYAAVDEFLSGLENLEMMGRLYHLDQKTSRRRATELLEQFDLVAASKRSVKTYSGGMRRRLDLALSLIAAPPVLFLDEPTTGLDPRSRQALWDIISGLLSAEVTILLTTQYMEEADKLADRIAVLDNGKIIAAGTGLELKTQAGKERLEVVLKESRDFKTTLNLIKGEAFRSDPASRTFSLATGETVSEVKRVLDILHENKIAVDSLSLHKPTLDDVFLQLTGHQAEKNPANQNNL